ncbi:flagellar motor protein [Frateuria aurantia]
MDLLSIIGAILAIAVILVGTVLKGSSISALWNPAAVVIVFFGTIAAVMVQTRGVVLKRAMKMISQVFKPGNTDIRDLISRIVGWSELARRQGLLGLEANIESETDEFARKGLQLLVDGTEPAVLRDMLESQIYIQEQADLAAAKVFESAGIYSPTMGIIGAVMGLMAVMQNLADPSKLGHGIAAAFVATIYGVALANLFMLPMYNKLKSLVHQRQQHHELLIEGLVAIANGDNPRLIESKLQGYIV